MKVKIEYFPHPKDCENCEDMPEYYASLPELKGMGESAKSAQDAFDQLILSLKVKLIYENKLDVHP